MSVLDFRTQSVPKDYSTLQGKTECYQKVWREWGEHLDPFEQVIMLVLIDRTIGWGRREAYFTTRALLDGDDIYAGMKIGRSKLFAALASLEKRGLIRRRKDPKIPDRVHYTVNMEWAPDMSLKLPKRLQGAQTPVHQTDYPVRQTDPIESNHKPVSTTSNQPGAAAPVSLNPANRVRAKAEGVRADHRAALKDRAENAQSTIARIEATWRAALLDTFPGTAYRTWGVREKAQVKIVHKNWRGDITFPEFVDWAVRNWTAIMAKQFKWMTKEPPPAVPVLSFLIAFLTQFADCRAEHKLEEWLSTQDRQSIESLMARRGLTWEQAMTQIAERKAAAALRG